MRQLSAITMTRDVKSIKPIAVQFGICRIVPPEGWTNPTQVDFTSSKKFATKLQRMSLMQDGRAMGDGHFYDIAQYKKMADDFRQKWCERLQLFQESKAIKKFIKVSFVE